VKQTKLNSITAFFLIVNVCLAAKPAVANPDQDIAASYIIRLNQPQLQVTLELSQIRSKALYISFINHSAGVDNLTARIGRVRARAVRNGENLPVKSGGNGLYEIQTQGESKINLSYDFNPRAVEHNHNLSVLTSSYLHISLDDFLAGVFSRSQDVENYDNLLYKDFRLKFTNLPAGWKTLTTYPVTQDGWVLIDNYEELLLHTGAYRTETQKINDCNFTFAFDQKIQFDRSLILQDSFKLIKYYSGIFKRTPVPEELIVINQSRGVYGPGWSYGGQAKKKNIILEFGGLNHKNQMRGRARLAGFLGHELFHIWLPGAFNIKDNWEWFGEGFTEYQSWRSLRELGVMNETQFRERIVLKYHKYETLNLKAKVSVLAATTRKFDPNPEYYTLIYDKGALIAYLLDRRLRKTGKDFNQFLAKLYQEYAVPQKPLGNRELIRFIDEYLGDSSFTRDYVRGTKILPIDPWREFGMGYFKIKFPPPPFPLNILIPLVVLILTGWMTMKASRRKKVRTNL
jgi:predicted metalloprotease with PDZ domain